MQVSLDRRDNRIDDSEVDAAKKTGDAYTRQRPPFLTIRPDWTHGSEFTHE
ncbi:hypothetical protein [Dyella sp. M7H15-1]|uniref:hypothetical protein n=1 Tax=Dyella sp. M7H15-1 TaxID=2501295 RepID=UPI001F0BC25A|nr:hypothetical protein [Dyella sp. M7H15-1]